MPQHAHDHVAGAGDVVNLPRPSREMLGPAVAMLQDHAVLVERDDGGFQIELSLAADRRRARASIVSCQDAARRQAGFEPVGRDARSSRDTCGNRGRGSDRRGRRGPLAGVADDCRSAGRGVQTPLS